MLSVFSFLFIAGLLSGRKLSQTVFLRVVQDAFSETAVAAEIRSEDFSIIVNSYLTDTGEEYMFLPSWTEGKRLAVDRSAASFSMGERVESGKTVTVDQEHTLTVLTGSEIPSVFLTLENDLSYISSDKTLSDSGQAVILDADGKSVYAGGLEKIKGRGNTSWEQDKKPFNISLKGVASIPGFEGMASEFALVTSGDASFLRNRISNEMAKVIGAPYMDRICVNLYINDSFQGVYEMYRRITPDSLGIWDLEAETEQLNLFQGSVSQCTTGVTLDDWNQSITGKWWDYEKDPKDITGGYILEMDHAGRYADEPGGFISDSGAYVVSKAPSRLSKAQYQYISSYTQACENAMVSGVVQGSKEELCRYIDISSFVAKYLVEEVSKNIDSSSTSQYFYKDRNGVLYAGPVWDYDWAYGVGREQEGIDYLDPEGFSAREIPGTLTWWQLLYYNSAVYQDIVGTYEETLYPYLNRLTQTELVLWEEEVAESAVMDYVRWNRCGSPDMEAAGNEYHRQTEAVRNFLAARKEFLHREWSAD